MRRRVRALQSPPAMLGKLGEHPPSRIPPEVSDKSPKCHIAII
jgi:hypothetical protein